MPNVSGIAALDVLIGLFFLYFVLSIVCSAINELVATAFNLRAGVLEAGIRNLLDDPRHAKDFFEHWRVRAIGKPKRPLLPDRKPSYMPSRVFALTVLDTFAPPDEGVDSHDLLERAKQAVAAAKAGTAVGGGTRLSRTARGMLEDAIDEAEKGVGSAQVKVESFRLALEHSFDEVMDRASGWYKRRVHYILLVVAAVLVGAMNADSFAIADRLWKDDALRSAVVAQANAKVTGQASMTSCGSQAGAEGSTPAAKAADCVDEIKTLGLPLGWSDKTTPAKWRSRGGGAKLLGLLVTVFALSLGAPFWFDLLGKVGRLRGAGSPSPPPEPTPLPPAANPPPAEPSPLPTEPSPLPTEPTGPDSPS